LGPRGGGVNFVEDLDEHMTGCTREKEKDGVKDDHIQGFYLEKTSFWEDMN